MEQGFAFSGINFVPCDELLKPICLPERLDNLPWWFRLISPRVKYFRAHLCRSCGCYIVDSSHAISFQEARQLAVGVQRILHPENEGLANHPDDGTSDEKTD
jgi:hypothetical protein